MKKETKNEKSMFKMSIMLRRVLFTLMSVFILCCMLGFANNNFTNFRPAPIEIDSNSFVKEDNKNIDIIENEFPYEKIRIQLIEEVDKYINKSTHGRHNKMLAQYLVDNSIKHDIDLCFMISQTKIETAFGTTGAGRPTARRSLFGIIKKSWKDYNSAINDYCLLLKKSYLVRGRTEYDLMRNYVTGSGSRYAGAKNYEAELRRAYNEICKLTNINELQNQYKSLYASNKASGKSDSIKVDSVENS